MNLSQLITAFLVHRTRHKGKNGDDDVRTPPNPNRWNAQGERSEADSQDTDDRLGGSYASMGEPAVNNAAGSGPGAEGLLPGEAAGEVKGRRQGRQGRILDPRYGDGNEEVCRCWRHPKSWTWFRPIRFGDNLYLDQQSRSTLWYRRSR